LRGRAVIGVLLSNQTLYGSNGSTVKDRARFERGAVTALRSDFFE
jgi:hypothetical protein